MLPNFWTFDAGHYGSLDMVFFSPFLHLCLWMLWPPFFDCLDRWWCTIQRHVVWHAHGGFWHRASDLRTPAIHRLRDGYSSFLTDSLCIQSGSDPGQNACNSCFAQRLVKFCSAFMRLTNLRYFSFSIHWESKGESGQFALWFVSVQVPLYDQLRWWCP